MMDLGTSIFNLMLKQQRQFCDTAGIKADVKVCGCCSFGCMCADHAPEHAKHTCWYHKLETPGYTVDGLLDLVEQKVPSPNKAGGAA